MKLDITINDETRRVEMLTKGCNHIVMKVNDRIYNVDVRHTSKFVYSLLLGQNSYNIEAAPSESNPKKYFINHGINNMEAKLTDCQTRYAQSRTLSGHTDDNNVIQTPMPGKIVKILVKEGDKVQEGDTIIIVEAMKMQSEYKSSGEKTVKKILVEEGDAIEGNQPLVILE
ncbi:MAG: acetyl-CoA carboxylase biotin carboxyl carrier protein subunit [Bacteroidales bacterium]|nr:acetyl-CoA carboxylase biotin carboxyl carrier protein subunit [Bacteroidales bacterium]